MMTETYDERFRIKMLNMTQRDLEDPIFLYLFATECEIRLPEKYEKIIAEATSGYAYLYAKLVIKDRWPLAEETIKTNLAIWFKYKKFLKKIGKHFDESKD